VKRYLYIVVLIGVVTGLAASFKMYLDYEKSCLYLHLQAEENSDLKLLEDRSKSNALTFASFRRLDLDERKTLYDENLKQWDLKDGPLCQIVDYFPKLLPLCFPEIIETYFNDLSAFKSRQMRSASILRGLEEKIPEIEKILAVDQKSFCRVVKNLEHARWLLKQLNERCPASEKPKEKCQRHELPQVHEMIKIEETRYEEIRAKFIEKWGNESFSNVQCKN
jgi:hypothetical protein